MAVHLIRQVKGSGGFFFSFFLGVYSLFSLSPVLPNDPAFSWHHDSGSGRCSVLDWVMSQTLHTAHTPLLWGTKPANPPLQGLQDIMKAKRRFGGSDPVRGQNQDPSLSPDLCTCCVHHCLACKWRSVENWVCSGRRCQTRLMSCWAMAAPQRPLYHLFMSCRLRSLPRKFICLRLLMTVVAASSSLLLLSK